MPYLKFQGEPRGKYKSGVSIALAGFCVACAAYVGASMLYPEIAPRLALMPEPDARPAVYDCSSAVPKFADTGATWRSNGYIWEQYEGIATDPCGS